MVERVLIHGREFAALMAESSVNRWTKWMVELITRTEQVQLPAAGGRGDYCVRGPRTWTCRRDEFSPFVL